MQRGSASWRASMRYVTTETTPTHRPHAFYMLLSFCLCFCFLVVVFFVCLSVQEAFSEFQVLEERITSVSTKVVHLGDQLEASNNRRMRAVEAQDLMYHLKQFEKPKPALEIFTDPGRVREG